MRAKQMVELCLDERNVNLLCFEAGQLVAAVFASPVTNLSAGYVDKAARSGSTSAAVAARAASAGGSSSSSSSNPNAAADEREATRVLSAEVHTYFHLPSKFTPRAEDRPVQDEVHMDANAYA
jgi:hypothetical protein